MRKTDKRSRCPWIESSKPDSVASHDNEWGVPVHDDRVIFEFLFFEGAQAGLNWYSVLQKRESFRRAFDCLNPKKIAQYGINEIKVLLEN